MNKKNVLVLLTIFVMAVFISACSNSSEENNTANSNKDDAVNKENIEENNNAQTDTTNHENESQNEQNADATNADQNETNTNNNETSESEPKTYEPENIFVGQGEQGMEGDYAKVKENLELPYFYENTKVYSGSINPDQTITFEIAQKNGGGTHTIKPEISKEGHFTLSLFNSVLNKENNVQMFIKGEMPHEAPFELPIQVEEDGRDIVPRNSEARETIEEETDLPDFYANTNSYYGKTVPDAEVTVIDPDMGDTLDMETDEDGNFSSSEFANFPYVAKDKANLQEGDTLVFLITDENGHSTYIEKDILARSDNPDYTEPVSE